MRIPVIEQAKIQAQVLVPLIKALQEKLGEERANALVRNALGAHYRCLGEQWRRKGSAKLGETMASPFTAFAASEALDTQVREQSPDTFALDVTRCSYAEFYKELGVPELGFLLVCTSDYPFAEGLGPGIQLTRTQTIMQGATHCDFRYVREG